MSPPLRDDRLREDRPREDRPREDRPSPRAPLGFNVDPSDRAYRRSGAAEPAGSSFSFDGIGRFVRPALAVLVAIACAGGLYLAYSRMAGKGESSGGVPLIRADQGVKKKADASTNQADTPDSTDAYVIGQDDPKAERLLPAPEEPLPKPVAVATPDAPPPTAVIAPPPNPAAPVDASPPPISSTPALPAPAPKAGAAPMTMASLTAIAAGETTPKPATAAAVASVPAGGLRVQIAATKDEATAQKEWQRLQKAHPDLLQDLSATYVRADLGDRGVYYRVQAGPLVDKAAADKLCNALKGFSIGCMIAKP